MAPNDMLKSRQVSDVVLGWIREGRFSTGQRLPSERAIADELSVNHQTVRRGLAELVGKGLIVKSPRVGSFVARKPSVGKRRIIKIGLAFRQYMLRRDSENPVMGAYLSGAHQGNWVEEVAIQSLFYRGSKFVEDIGRVIVDRELSGVVVVGGRFHDKDYEFLRSNNVHVVQCLASGAGKQEHDDMMMSINVDRTAVMRQAVEHLRLLWHKRIGFISYQETADGSAIHRSYSKLAFDHRLGNPHELLIQVRNAGPEVHWEDVERFFEIRPLPTSVIVMDEGMADVLLDVCARRGVRVPDELSLVALQDARPQGHLIPLTAPNSAKVLKRVSCLACDLLIKRILGKPIATTQITIKPELEVKASSGPPFSGNAK